ncbi:MAG: zinc-dependent metalloprotease, partial [Propionibacteriaceae bacterium]|nr:zinc-dependent metalloprotease [Propionibacteriaceae bacterium]
MADFDPDDPLARFLAQFGITPGDDWREHPERLLERLQSMMRSFNTQMAGYGPADAESGMNWSFARDVARRSMAAARKGSGSGSERLAAVRDAASLAGMWLDGEVAFPGSGQLATCWTPEDWLDKTFPTWQQLLRPVVGSLVAALQELIGQDGDDEVARTLRPMVRASATAMQATTIGQSLGKLALSALSASDAGIPLSRQPQV